MTTKPKSSTLPAYKYIFPSEVAGEGMVITSDGSTSSKDAWSYKAASIAPKNLSPLTAISPQGFSIKGQNASGFYAATGGDITISPGTGSVGNTSGNLVIADTAGNGGTWNTSHAVLGIYHLWIDAAGRLRIKSSRPTSDTDGAVVGSQA